MTQKQHDEVIANASFAFALVILFATMTAWAFDVAGLIP